MEALRGLQERMIDAHTQLKQLALQRRAKERTIKECTLVSEQLQPLSSDVKMFKSNGRAYFLAPKDVILEGLKTTAETAAKDMEVLKTGQTKLEAELKEIEQNLQELSKTTPEATS